MALTERQETMIKEIRAAAAYLKGHGTGKAVTLSLLLETADIANAGSFYAMVDAVKKSGYQPGLQSLRELKKEIGELGIIPSCLEAIPEGRKEASVAAKPRKGIPTPPVSSPEDGDPFSEAWNTCRKAMLPLPQHMRENLARSIASSFGLGE